MGKFWKHLWELREKKPITENFRSDGGPHGQVEQFIVRPSIHSGKVDLPPHYMRDSLVGNPLIYEEVCGVQMTHTSIDHAYMAKMAPSDWKPNRVIEIGGGFGGLAWSAAQRDWPWPEKDWTFVDHPAQLAVQKFFVERALPRWNFNFLMPEELEEMHFSHAHYDLAICTRAFGEMDPEEVEFYGRELTRVVDPGGHLYIVTWIEKVTSLEFVKKQFTDWDLIFELDWPMNDENMVQLKYERRI